MQPAPAAEQLDVGSACSSTGERFLPWLQWETCPALLVPTDVLYHHSPSSATQRAVLVHASA